MSEDFEAEKQAINKVISEVQRMQAEINKKISEIQRMQSKFCLAQPSATPPPKPTPPPQQQPKQKPPKPPASPPQPENVVEKLSTPLEGDPELGDKVFVSIMDENACEVTFCAFVTSISKNRTFYDVKTAEGQYYFVPASCVKLIKRMSQGVNNV